MSPMVKEFQQKVLSEGTRLYRDMPWRNTQNPYYVLLSEVMLQQTQVDRVIPYFEKFIKEFPTVKALGEASFQEVLACWSGLGYNRRAQWLQEAARIVAEKYGEEVPTQVEELVTLPGIGKNTAAAICVYAYNQPKIFIETNIRTVYIHHFFADHVDDVKDADILELLEKTLYKENPRQWYWALMDYGTFLKKTHGNLSQKSSSYRKQSTFKGSVRQARGAILKLFLSQEVVTSGEVFGFDTAFDQLEKEGFIVQDKKGSYRLKK